MSLLHLTLLAACGPTAHTGMPVDTDTDTDTDADTDTDTDIDTDTDTDTDRSGLLQYEGRAVALDSYLGTEDTVFIDEDGEGEELCRVQLSFSSTAVRDDCAVCAWAFTVEVTDVTVATDIACDAIEMGDAAALIGTTRGYGYTPDYYGHAPLLLTWTEGEWQPASYAFWSEESGDLLYTWVVGFRDW